MLVEVYVDKGQKIIVWLYQAREDLHDLSLPRDAYA